MTRVLVVEDDPQLVRALVINLQARQYGVDPAPDGTTALRIAAARQPDVVLLDLGLPDMDGTDVIEALRGWTRVPILVLSARRASDEKVAALDAGADDYITKPFALDELLARLRAPSAGTEDIPLAPETVLVTTEHFTIDLLAKKAVQGGHDVRLTPTEWHLLEILVTNPGRLITQRQLLQEVWGVSQSNKTNYLQGLHRPDSAANSRRTPPPPLPHHRTRHGIPLRELTPVRGGPRYRPSRPQARRHEETRAWHAGEPDLPRCGTEGCAGRRRARCSPRRTARWSGAPTAWSRSWSATTGREPR